MPASRNSRQAYAWPTRKRIPSPVAIVHQRLNRVRLPAWSLRRPCSSAKLEASRITVFRNRIGGLCTLTQSVEISRRINKAAVKAMNTTVLETRRRKTRMNDARREEPAVPGSSGGESLPQPGSVGGDGPCPINASDQARQRKPRL